METFRFTPGSGPVLVSLPHIGTLVPPAIRARLSPAAEGLPDSKIGTFSEALFNEAKKQGWTVISMKNDWKRLFSFDK